MASIKNFFRKYGVPAALLVVSALVALVLADVILSSVRATRLSSIPPQKPSGYMVFDPELGYDISPSAPKERSYFKDGSFLIWSNSLGCFDEEYGGEKPYTLLVGDSFAWGWVPHEDNWGKHIERLSGTRVLTCGVDGFGTIQEGIKASRIIAKVGNPSLIIVSYLGANDIDDDTNFPNYVAYGGKQIHSVGTTTCETGTCAVAPPDSAVLSAKVWLNSHSVVYNLTKQKLYAPLLRASRGDAQPPAPETPPPLPAVHTEAMQRLSDLAKSSGAKLVVVLVPTKEDVRANYTYSNMRMQAFLDSRGIKYVDLLPVFKEQESLPERPLYWTHDGHWNPEGNRVAGLAVGAFLLENNLIKIEDRASLLTRVRGELLGR